MQATRSTAWIHGVVLGTLVCLITPAIAEAQTAKVLYDRAVDREAAARKTSTVTPYRSAVSAYELVVRRHPRSGYCDDALWNGAELARSAWERFGQAADRVTAERLYSWLRREYPTSAKAKLAPTQMALLTASRPSAKPANPPPSKPAPASTPSADKAPARPAPTPTPTLVAPPAATPPAPASPTAPTEAATLKNVSVLPLPKGDRVVLELDREVLFTSERIADPDRVFFDLRHAEFTPTLQTSAEALAGSRISGLRLGKQDGHTSRVVLELAGRPTHTVFLLYNPYRLVIDVESDAAPDTSSPGSLGSQNSQGSRTDASASEDATPATPAAPAPSPAPPASSPAPPARPTATPAPATTTLAGDYTLARQLGLGVSRIVIDPGHGGHDPGARANALVEADLVLDIALRVEALLKKQAGVEVVLTRRTNIFIPLEERTAIANREGADLFLSIHANAARRLAAKGVETYFLNFAANPDAEEIAARENATSSHSMGKLPSLIQQITLNTKVNESREFARLVQTNMIRGLRTQNKAVQDLGVKQAPFVVLIGAQMPSVLAEISFLTNRAEASLLKKEAYKQRIAQSLADAVLKYQASLKKAVTVPAAK